MQDNSGYKNDKTRRALVDAVRRAQNNTRLTELFHQNNPQDPRIYRAQASDYSRKPIQIAIADVVAMFFAGIVVTLLVAFLMESSGKSAQTLQLERIESESARLLNELNGGHHE